MPSSSAELCCPGISHWHIHPFLTGRREVRPLGWGMNLRLTTSTRKTVHAKKSNSLPDSDGMEAILY